MPSAGRDGAMMTWPDGVPTRRVSAGRGLSIERGTSLGIRLTVRSERELLVWAATGERLMSLPARAEAGPGAGAELVLPCTDSAGWLDEHGQEIDVSVQGSYTHRYVATIDGIDSTGKVVSTQQVVFALPAGDETMDLDRGVEAGTVEGDVIVIPSEWGLFLTGAQDAADRAEAARDAAEAVAAAPDGIRDNADRAEAAREAAVTARAGAETERTTAQGARAGAEAARDLAAGSATSADASKTAAAGSATAAAGSATAAAGSASAAATSATNAATARTAAETAKTAAETAQSAAVTARTAAQTARTGAETAQTGAQTARTGAETARTGAEAAQVAAEAARDDVVDLLADTGWVDVTLNSGFEMQTGNPLQVRRVRGNEVYIRGGLANTGVTVSTIQSVGSVPSGFYPSGQVGGSPGVSNGAGVSSVNINVNGLIQLRTGAGTSAYYLLSSLGPWLTD